MDASRRQRQSLKRHENTRRLGSRLWTAHNGEPINRNRTVVSMPMPRLCTLALALAFLIQPADSTLAASYEAETLIETVTVQPDRAQITRRGTVEAEAGSHLLVLADLPIAIMRPSLRITTDTPSVALGRPELREVETTEPVRGAARRLTEELELLRQQRRIERDIVKAQELTLGVLGRAQINVELTDEASMRNPTSLFAMLEARSKAALQSIRTAEQTIERLDAEIDRTERQLDQLGQDPMRRLEVTLPARIDNAGPIELHVAYDVRDAGFTPLLEARLDSRTAELTLEAFADVVQNTGEDWQDVVLTLSTAQPSWQTAAPPVETWYIDIRPDEPRPLARMQESMAMVAAAPKADVMLDRSGFDVAYAIEELQTIAADGAVHRVPIQTITLPAEVVWRTVPALSATAYLTADVTYEGPAPLLPGSVQLYRDGMAIGETYYDGLRPGGDLELGFGADPAVEIDYRLLTDRRAESGLIGTTRRHERRYVVEATNRRKDAVTLEILERLPVPRDERIEVRLLPDTTTPDTRTFDEKPGILAWTRRIDAGETVETLMAYEIRHPADIEITDF